jgi:hypothetical protein
VLRSTARFLKKAGRAKTFCETLFRFCADADLGELYELLKQKIDLIQFSSKLDL